MIVVSFENTGMKTKLQMYTPQLQFSSNIQVGKENSQICPKEIRLQSPESTDI